VTKTLAVLTAMSLCVVAPAIAQDAKPKETVAQKVERLIQELGADGEGSYEVRESAQKQLEAIGRPALPALDKAAKSKDLEVASRAGEAVAKIRKGKRGVKPPVEKAPQDELRRGPPIPQPNMDEVMKELERQMPKGLGELFKQFFDNGESDKGEQDEERRPDGMPKPRIRTWTWQMGPNSGQAKKNDPASALGLTTGPCSAALRSQLDIAKLEGRVINRVNAGGYAERHGLKLHDVIVAVDGRALRRTSDLLPLLEKACKVEVFRKAKLKTLQMPRAGSQAPKAKKGTEKQDSDGRKQRSF
jgi:hypothetical protein